VHGEDARRRRPALVFDHEARRAGDARVDAADIAHEWHDLRRVAPSVGGDVGPGVGFVGADRPDEEVGGIRSRDGAGRRAEHHAGELEGLVAARRQHRHGVAQRERADFVLARRAALGEERFDRGEGGTGDTGREAQPERLRQRRADAVEDGPRAVDVTPARAACRIELGAGLDEAAADGALGPLEARRQRVIDERIRHGRHDATAGPDDARAGH